METNQTEDPQPIAYEEIHRAAFAGPVQLAILYCLCAWLAYDLFETVQRIIAFYVPLPVQDYWRVAQNLHEYQALHLGVFWMQHNEHRIVFPEIVFALDMLLAHGRLILPMVCSFVCYALTWAVLSFAVLRDRETPLASRCCAILVAAIITFWQGSAFALAQPFLLEWPLMQYGVVLALFFLKSAAETLQTRYLAATILAAVVATYSSANALLLWPLLLGIGIALRLTKRFLTILGISAIVFIGLYFIGYRFSTQSNFAALLLHPLYFMGFSASYLSMPFGAIKSAGFGVFLGLANLALLLFLLTLARRFRLLTTRPVVVLSGYYLFTLLTIAITAAGRMDPADPNFTAARVGRYLTVPLLNWAALLLLCLWMSARLQWRVFTTKTLTIVFSLLILTGSYKLRTWQQSNAGEFAGDQLAALSIDVGLTDSQIITRIFPSPELVDSFLPELKKQRLAMFYRDHQKWLGEDVSQFGAIRQQHIPGEISYVSPVEHGLEVVGWVNSDDVRDPYPRIFLANERGKIVGFGRRPEAGFPADLRSLKTPEMEAWVAFVNLAIASHSISAYAATRHGLAPIAGIAAVPAFGAAAREEAGAPVRDVTWRMDKTWALNGIPVTPRFGWQPAGASYSSWQGHDENAGQIAAEFATPANGCVILPVLHGPSTGGASAQLVDADSGSVLADLPFRERDVLWSLWRVPVNAGVKRLRFVATDNGREWGQWLAVSAPLECGAAVATSMPGKQ